MPLWLRLLFTRRGWRRPPPPGYRSLDYILSVDHSALTERLGGRATPSRPDTGSPGG